MTIQVTQDVRCPDWCELTMEEHGWDEGTPAEPERTHAAVVGTGPFSTTVERTDKLTADGIIVGELRVRLWLNGDSMDTAIPAGDAAEAAAALTDACARVSELRAV